MESIKKQSFVHGALILVFANFLVKVIGAIFKIPLANFLGKSGMGHFSVAYQIYTFMFIISTAGFPIAVSKMISEYEAKKRYGDCKKIFKIALMFLGFIGLFGSVMTFVFSKKLGLMLGCEDAYSSIMAISPSIFFVSALSAFRGYFQGMQNMYPTAISEVIEALSKLLLGLFASIFFIKMKINPNINKLFNLKTREIKSFAAKTQMASSGAIIGVTSGTFLSLLILIFIYVYSAKKTKTLKNTYTLKNVSILKKLVLIAFPITIGASVSSLTSILDLLTTMNRLVVNPKVFDKYNSLFNLTNKFSYSVLNQNLSYAEVLREKANILFGMYNGYAVPMFNLPLTIIVSLAMCLVPAISFELAKNNQSRAKNITESALNITLLFSIPCSFAMSVLARPILSTLYSGDIDARFLLQKLSFAIVFVSIVSVSNAILQAHGKLYCPVINMLFGGLIKILFNYFLIPVFGIDLVPISTIICYASVAILNLFFIFKCAKVKINFKFLIKILLSSLSMSVASLCIFSFFEKTSFFSLKFFNVAALALAVFVSLLVYIFLIFTLRAIKHEDLESLFKRNFLKNTF